MLPATSFAYIEFFDVGVGVMKVHGGYAVGVAADSASPS